VTRFSIQAKVVLAVAGCMLALLAAATLLVTGAAREEQRASARRALAASGHAFDDAERSEIEKLSAALEPLLANGALQEAFAARDRERVQALAAPAFRALRERHAVTHLYFLDGDRRTCFLRVHAPELHGDVVARPTFLRAIQSGDLGAGTELGRTAFALRVVRPWRVDGRIIGYVELGEEIDHFLARVKAATHDDVALVIAKEHLDEREWAAVAERAGRRSGWDDHADVVVVNSTVPPAELGAVGAGLEALPAAGALLDQRVLGGRVLQRGALPVSDAAGRQVGALVVLHDQTAAHRRLERHRNLLVATIAGATVALAALLILLLRRLVLDRLQRMMAAMEEAGERLAGGDASVGEGIVATSDDELGRFEEFFGRFLRVLGELVRSIGPRDPR
jgi:hypothetical protein